MAANGEDLKTGNIGPGRYDVALVGLCAFLGLIPAWLNYDVISKDGAFQYIPMAKAFLGGSFRDTLLNSPQLPLFPLIMAAVTKATGLDLELSGRAISYFGYVLACMGMYQLSSLLFRNRAVSCLASLFIATNALLMKCSVDCLKESVFLCAIIGANILAVRGLSAAGRRWPWYLGAAASFGAGALLRSTALVFLCAWLILWVFHKSRGRYARAALLAAPVAAFYALWFFVPEFSLFRKSSYQLGGFFGSMHGMQDFFRSLGSVPLNFFDNGNPVLMFFAFYGLHRRGKDFYSCHVLLTLGIFSLILALWLFSSGRYYLAPVAWAYPLAAYGVLEAFSSRRRVYRAASAVAVLSCLVMWGYRSALPPEPDKVAWKEAGAWIREELGPGREVVSNQERLVYYAQGKPFPLSAYREGKGGGRVLAIDARKKAGAELDARMRALGYEPARRFRQVSVYLPDGLRY